jgi:hypothetical protein
VVGQSGHFLGDEHRIVSKQYGLLSVARVRQELPLCRARRPTELASTTLYGPLTVTRRPDTVAGLKLNADPATAPPPWKQSEQRRTIVVTGIVCLASIIVQPGKALDEAISDIRICSDARVALCHQVRARSGRCLAVAGGVGVGGLCFGSLG